MGAGGVGNRGGKQERGSGCRGIQEMAVRVQLLRRYYEKHWTMGGRLHVCATARPAGYERDGHSPIRDEYSKGAIIARAILSNTRYEAAYEESRRTVRGSEQDAL